VVAVLEIILQAPMTIVTTSIHVSIVATRSLVNINARKLLGTLRLVHVQRPKLVLWRPKVIEYILDVLILMLVV